MEQTLTLSYDSTADTLWHIKRVNELLSNAAIELIKRGQVHDKSKLKSPEKELFDEMTPKLKNLTYGSEEYTASLKELEVALNHHYAKNNHHPQHYPNGVQDMNLFDIVEMFFDWKAASERHTDGNIRKSISVNDERFNLNKVDLAKVMENTVNFLGW